MYSAHCSALTSARLFVTGGALDSQTTDSQYVQGNWSDSEELRRSDSDSGSNASVKTAGSYSNPTSNIHDVAERQSSSSSAIELVPLPLPTTPPRPRTADKACQTSPEPLPPRTVKLVRRATLPTERYPGTLVIYNEMMKKYNSNNMPNHKTLVEMSRLEYIRRLEEGTADYLLHPDGHGLQHTFRVAMPKPEYLQ